VGNFPYGTGILGLPVLSISEQNFPWQPVVCMGHDFSNPTQPVKKNLNPTQPNPPGKNLNPTQPNPLRKISQPNPTQPIQKKISTQIDPLSEIQYL
jgi:hypothetical protein